ncbi:hypothetical protein A9P82_01355 [Arachidicoccus ginsenosidimutans]|uniref:hypothetical protein n=1 Tax=Arachidicoccus sp. BS20 TaxID=1850526 RepID=UPI0007F127E1|nr:hypothetical protein [Arachidicoccus sp. BS20]ANI88077.1 hypothetical protein A9P82_01355 [Arachidicoccus sp. BS20]
MEEEKVYKIISWVLMPFTVLVGLSGVGLLLTALLYPPAFMSAIFVVGVVVYTIISQRFFKRNICRNAKAKMSVQLWIRVSAFFVIGYIMETVQQGIEMLSFDKDSLKQALQSEISQVQSILHQSSLPVFSVDMLYNFSRGITIAFLVYALLLLLHLLLSFLFLKRYRYLFEKQ